MQNTEVRDKVKINKKKSKARRNNAILYPIYKVFAWDLLCYYSIEYLFLTITKGISPSQVLITATAAYTISKVLMQIPSIIISEYIGKRKSIIFANLIILIHILLLMWAPNIGVIFIAEFFAAIGYDIKDICDGNLLYDSVATKGGDGLYTKLETKGGSGYYILDAVLSIMAGYLFVINNYIPMWICAGCLLIALIISYNLKDIYPVKKEKRKPINLFIKEYKTDIRDSFKFIKRSNRMRAYLIFGALFYAIIKVFDKYKSTMLTDIGIRSRTIFCNYGNT